MLVGKKVILEEIDPDNIEWMRQQRNDPEMRQYFREWKDISKDKQLEWYKSCGNNSNPNHVYFQIMYRNQIGPDDNVNIDCNKKLVGCCGLHYVDWRLRLAEFGVFVASEVRGNGIGGEAIFMMFDFGFREMNLHKIWCEVYDNNKAIDVYHKIGFKDDGILRDNYFCNGKYGNSTVMSILEDEWFEKHGGR